MSEITMPFSADELSAFSEKVRKIITETGHYLAGASISQTTCKGGNANFVTDLDVLVQNRLVKALTPLLPDAAFLLEESDEIPDQADYTWVIDPIDGTKNFINHYNESAISVALIYRNTGLLGMVFNPFKDEFFSALKGQGAYLNGAPIHVSDSDLSKAIICLGTAPYYTELHEKVIRCMEALYPLCGDFRRSGSAALDLCYVACGRADAFIEYRLCAWDYAAASIIIQEAGGCVSSTDLPAWDYTAQSGVLAGGPVLFADFEKTIKAI